MPISPNQIERISCEIIAILDARFDSFPEDASNNRNAPFHEAFLAAFDDKICERVSDVPFFVSLSSWMQGLNTTLGQVFFENVAHILSGGEKREYTSKKLGNLYITSTQKNTVTERLTNLSTKQSTPNLTDEDLAIAVSEDPTLVLASDFSADVFIDDGSSIVAIEMKTVKPNSGEMNGEKRKILEGKAALVRQFPDHSVSFYLGFPFDPTSVGSPTGYDKERFGASVINLTKFFSLDEILIAGELWDFLSGEENTMDLLLGLINSIATPNFVAQFAFINEVSNRASFPDEYAEALKAWNLVSELHLFENDVQILEAIGTNKSLMKIYKQLPFKGGKYNRNRFIILSNLI